MSDHILRSLNTQQLDAVTASGNLLVLAGAGSGKTRVLVHRIAWLLQNKISPHNVLAVTFTNKAAREMRERLGKLISAPIDNMWVGTFHGLANRILRNHWQEANLAQNFQILDSDDQLRLLKQVYKALNLNEDKWPVKQAQWFINNQKDEGIRPNNVNHNGDFFVTNMLKVYYEYQKICQRNNLVDFAELLLKTWELFQQTPVILDQYQERFSHVLVDEFQDTNTIQYNWLSFFKKSSLTAVGDDDQSIYGWRGAKIENMNHLPQDFPNLKIIRLEQNYRSSSNILHAANAVIANNINRLGKELWTDGAKGDLITSYIAANELDEARFVVACIHQHLHLGRSPNEMAILYRSNAQSRVFEERLIQEGIPYSVHGGLRFFDRAEIKDALGYLRLLVNRNDDSAFIRIINTPARGIGETTLTAIREISKENSVSLWEATKEALVGNKLNKRALNALVNFVQLIDQLSLKIADLSLAEQIKTLLIESGLYNHFLNDKSEKQLTRVENLDELINAATQFSLDLNESTYPASAFLARVALEMGDSQDDRENNTVQLMTLHSAKGLEFPIVFLVGLEAGLFPHQSSMDNPVKLEEERRLCYVGITRAMQKLYVTYARSRRLHGSETYRHPSPFLGEIPAHLIDNISLVRTQPTIAATYLLSKDSSYSGLFIGQTIHHQKFGEGVILNFEGHGENAKVNINFKNCGSKWLLASYVKG